MHENKITQVAQFTDAGETKEGPGTEDDSPVAMLKVIARVATEELEIARTNSTMFEEKAQQVAEKALALHDQAGAAEMAAEASLASIETILAKEVKAEEILAAANAEVAAAHHNFCKAEKALLLARWKLEPPGTSLDDMSLEGFKTLLHQSVVTDITEEKGDDSLEEQQIAELDLECVVGEGSTREEGEDVSDVGEIVIEKETLVEYQLLEIANAELLASESILARCETELAQIQTTKMELQEEAMHRNMLCRLATEAAALADEDVAAAMTLAEEAVAMEVEAAHCVSDAEIALHKAEVKAEDAAQVAFGLATVEAEKLSKKVAKAANVATIETEHKQDVEGVENKTAAAEAEEKVGFLSLG